MVIHLHFHLYGVCRSHISEWICRSLRSVYRGGGWPIRHAFRSTSGCTGCYAGQATCKRTMEVVERLNNGPHLEKIHYFMYVAGFLWQVSWVYCEGAWVFGLPEGSRRFAGRLISFSQLGLCFYEITRHTLTLLVYNCAGQRRTLLKR